MNTRQNKDRRQTARRVEDIAKQLGLAITAVFAAYQAGAELYFTIWKAWGKI